MEGIRARADVFDEQILRHILSFVPGSAELAPKYSLQPETGHYLVKAGWPVVLRKCAIGRRQTPPSVFAAAQMISSMPWCKLICSSVCLERLFVTNMQNQ